MTYEAKILADSLSPHGVRLTTMEITLPRIVLAELNTHRMFSRNSASSRAIPIEKKIEAVEADPFIPEQFGKNQKGMQADDVISESATQLANVVWRNAMYDAVAAARQLASLKVHKQLANRLIEPFSWQTVIITATEWSNFFALRCNAMAQPEIRKPAEMMREVMNASVPRQLNYDDWHLPLIFEKDLCADISNIWNEASGSMKNNYDDMTLVKVSVARCARVSYLTHDGKRNFAADIELYDRLANSGHLSPFEHVARPMTVYDAQEILLSQMKSTGDAFPDVDINEVFSGNFRSWVSHRKSVKNENDFSKVL